MKHHAEFVFTCSSGHESQLCFSRRKSAIMGRIQRTDSRVGSGGGLTVEKKTKKRYKLISCEILFREVCYCAALCDHIIDVQFVRKGLHDMGTEKMAERLQSEIDQVDVSGYDAILLCYGLCNNGVVNLSAEIPLVIPRANDCITLLLGSKERYNEYFDSNPGTFFKSSGWLERDVSPYEAEGGIMSQLGLQKTYEEYVELYGEENADYIAEILGNWEANYKKIAYINTKVGNIETDRICSREAADDKRWEYEEVEGDMRLIAKLLAGEWDDSEFLVIPGGCRIRPSNDEGIVCCTSESDL